MASSKQAYLAANYMSGVKAEAILSRIETGASRKKKKATSSSVASTSFIKDDDADWGGAFVAGANGEDEENDVALGDAIVASDRSFKKRRTAGGGWETIRVPTPPPADEQPVVVQREPHPALSGGLLSGDQIKRIRGDVVIKDPAQSSQTEQDTIYRDSSGRKIDTKAERAAAARAKRIQDEKEAQKMEWGKGIVQREEVERKRIELDREKTRDIARYANDAELNAEQKQQERWNDPAAAFLSKKQNKGPRKPEYVGPPPPPNRFAIKPGYRWDGVDRGNGFEQKLFQRGNERQRRGLEAYEWSVDDM